MHNFYWLCHNCQILLTFAPVTIATPDCLPSFDRVGCISVSALRRATALYSDWLHFNWMQICINSTYRFHQFIFRDTIIMHYRLFCCFHQTTMKLHSSMWRTLSGSPSSKKTSGKRKYSDWCGWCCLGRKGPDALQATQRGPSLISGASETG